MTTTSSNYRLFLNTTIMNQLLTVSLRQKAIYIPAHAMNANAEAFSAMTGLLVANLAKLGFGVDEELLTALKKTVPAYQAQVQKICNEVMGMRKNWTPLIQGWEMANGDARFGYMANWFATHFRDKGIEMPCGHVIPSNAFPLHRYKGCPFCGKPFQQAEYERKAPGSEERVLVLWTDEEVTNFFTDLLSSKTALDATQMESLKTLLAFWPLPAVKIRMKETLMAVIDIYVKTGHAEKAQVLFTTPADILRYLWYKHTGNLQVIEPATIVRRKMRNNRYLWKATQVSEKLNIRTSLKLKYTRREGLMVAGWLNNLEIDIEDCCDAMHAKRRMWVRFIRALRLAEYSKRKGFEKLHFLLDVFYNKVYTVYQAEVERQRLFYNPDKTFALLKQRPGLFARSLFANMLWFGHSSTMKAFAEVRHRVPARLLFTLEMYAADYFEPNHTRSVKPLGGSTKRVPANQLLSFYSEEQREEMKAAVKELCLQTVADRFAALTTESKTIYIDPALHRVPVSIGDRAETIQDVSGALMGTRFAVKGDKLRLFMQWGTGLPAQHLDMDLSCKVVYDGYNEHCSYQNLVIAGCKHSGDIIHIPHMKGAAEFLELDLQVLKNLQAKYIMFTCNAFSNGSIAPNLVVGWMDSKHKMTVSNNSGVGYDPSSVQHQVRIGKSLAKGLLFGVLEVQKGEIVWMEMPFEGQLVQDLGAGNVEAYLRKLSNKITVGALLQIKASAQGLLVVETPAADEVYTKEWAVNTAAVTKLLID